MATHAPTRLERLTRSLPLMMDKVFITQTLINSQKHVRLVSSQDETVGERFVLTRS